MSRRHPIVAVTGSSGSGTSSTRPVFDRIFESLGIHAAYVDGDSFHTYDREQTLSVIERARIRGENFSQFSPAANQMDRLDALFQAYGTHGTGTVRRYLHSNADAEAAGLAAGTFTDWAPLPPDTDVLLYEGLHGGLVTEEHDIAQHVDLLIGMTPIINLEWIQKIRRDTAERGYVAKRVTKTILRRMPDYVKFITPQFSRTDVNFQRVPLVDTSNPFAVQDIPPLEESLLVIHVNEQGRLPADFDELLADVPGAFQTRPNTLVVPGERMFPAMEHVLGPALKALSERRQAALA